jgi:hypothetical protein
MTLSRQLCRPWRFSKRTGGKVCTLCCARGVTHGERVIAAGEFSGAQPDTRRWVASLGARQIMGQRDGGVSGSEKAGC